MNRSNCEQDYLDEYVVGMQNPSQLVGSLAFMLKERNYVCIYDTSILSSPESHIKKTSLDELNRDFLYKWYLFFKGLVNNLTSYSNLIIITEVAEEMYNLITASLSSLNKRKKQYKSLSPREKERLQDIFEQILNNEEILLTLQEILDKYRHQSSPVIQPVYDSLLELIKLLNVNLELKKSSSRESNDTDERVAARTFYEIMINNYKVAVYTRDDDIRKLISATYKFLMSMPDDSNSPVLKNLTYLNILALKYNKEKRAYSRFFESSTLPYVGDFRFPRKLSKNKVNQILSSSKEILNDIQQKMKKVLETRGQEQQEQVKKVDPEEKAQKALKSIFESFSQFTGKEETETCDFKVDVLGNLAILAEFLELDSLRERIIQSEKQSQRASLENIVKYLEAEKISLKKKFEELSSQQDQAIEYWKQIQEVAKASGENQLKLNFFENALRNNLANVNYEDYENFKRLLDKFQRNGFKINDEESPVPQGKIAEILDMPIAKTIQTIENYQIKHQRTHVFLTQERLMLFLRH